VLAAAAAVLLGGLAVVGPVSSVESAAADTLAPIGPISILPSEVEAVAPKLLTGSGLADWTAGNLYNFVKSGNLRMLAEVAQEYPSIAAAQTARAITAEQAAALTSSVAAEVVPVTAAEGLTVAGVAAGSAQAFGVGMLGFALTNGVLRATNVTTDGLVCMNTGSDPIGSLTQLATGTDCGRWQQALSYTPNADQAPGATSFPDVCDPVQTSACAHLQAVVHYSATLDQLCFTFTGMPATNQSGSVTFWMQNVTYSSGASTSPGNTAGVCPNGTTWGGQVNLTQTGPMTRWTWQLQSTTATPQTRSAPRPRAPGPTRLAPCPASRSAPTGWSTAARASPCTTRTCSCRCRRARRCLQASVRSR